MAYTQQFGRPNVESAAVNYLTDKDKKDPVKPFKPVAGEFNEELDGITITASGNKPVTGPSNRAESIERQKQIKAGYGKLLSNDPSYNENPNITRTTSTVTKVNNENEPYSMTRNTFSNASGGQPVNVDNTPSAVFIGPRDKGTFFDSADGQQQVQNSRNYMNSPNSSTRRGSEMQNWGTYVTGGRNSGEPLRGYIQNMQSGSIGGQIFGEGTGRYVGQTTNTLPNLGRNEFAQDPNGYTPLLSGGKMRSSSILGMKPQDAMNYIAQDSLGKQENRFSRGIFKAALKERNSMFPTNITSGRNN